jgi:hypothetical protein
VAAYVPGPYDGRVTVFRAAANRRRRRDLGWSRVARDVEVHVIPGTHLTFITRHVAMLGETLRGCLGRAVGAGAAPTTVGALTRRE